MIDELGADYGTGGEQTIVFDSVITQGPWCNQVVTNASGKTVGPSNVTGATYSQGGGRVHLSWDASPDLDYKLTEIRVGASWAAGTKIASPAATAFD